MLRLENLKPLNCSAGGVLYHYCTTWERLNKVLERGISPSRPEHQQDRKYNVPFVSFSRTRINPAIVGPSRWRYGIVFSKDVLSNFGKIAPYHHGGHRGADLELKFHDPEFNEDALSKPIILVIEILDELEVVETENGYEGNYTGQSRLIISFGGVTANTQGDSVTYKLFTAFTEYIKDWLVENDSSHVSERWIDEFAEEPDCVIYENTVILDKFCKQVPNDLSEMIYDALDKVRKRNGGPRDNIISVRTMVGLESPDVWTPFRMDDDRYKQFKHAVRTIEDANPGYVNRDGDIIELDIPLDVFGRYFKDMPPFIQALASKSTLYESEDRLLLPGYKPKVCIPETKKAIIGVILPRSEYYSERGQELMDRYPNLKFYAYDNPADRFGPNKGKPDKPIPKEAYQNPIA